MVACGDLEYLSSSDKEWNSCRIWSHIAQYLFATFWLWISLTSLLVICTLTILFIQPVLGALRYQSRFPSSLRLNEVLLLPLRSHIHAYSCWLAFLIATWPSPITLLLTNISHSCYMLPGLLDLLIMLIDAFFWAALLTCQTGWCSLLGCLVCLSSWLVDASSCAAGLACQAGLFTLLDSPK